MPVGELNVIPGFHQVSRESSSDVAGTKYSNFDCVHMIKLPRPIALQKNLGLKSASQLVHGGSIY